MFKQICLIGLVLAAAATPLFAVPEPIVVSKTVRDNPTIYFDAVANDTDLTRDIRTFLGACGWFDLSNNPGKSDYQLTGVRNGNTLTLKLARSGVPAGAWNLTVTANSRLIAKHAVDAIIEKTFQELKVRGFCTSKIAFCAQTARGIRNIYICDIDGGDVRQITRYNTLCVEPCWFPDGNSIGYSKYAPTGIEVIETQFRPRRSRILSSFAGINAGAAISPDGRNLAVILSPDHLVDLYVMPVGGRTPRRLTKSIAVEASPCWSPDGRSLAFVSDETGSPRIFTINADGSNRKKLPSIGTDAVTPDWSKNGKIVYAAKVDGSYTIGVYDTKTGKNERATTAPGNWESPAWAADNRQVVCKRSDGGGKSALYVVDTMTGKTRLLVSTPYNLSMPVWSPCAE